MTKLKPENLSPSAAADDSEALGICFDFNYYLKLLLLVVVNGVASFIGFTFSPPVPISPFFRRGLR